MRLPIEPDASTIRAAVPEKLGYRQVGRFGSFDWEELLDLGKELGTARIGIRSIVRCLTPSDFESIRWGKLRGDTWFGTILADSPETS